MDPRAKLIVAAIVADLESHIVLGNGWLELDDETRAKIVATWEQIVDDLLKGGANGIKQP